MRISEDERAVLLRVLQDLWAGTVYLAFSEMETITCWTESDARALKVRLMSGWQTLTSEEQRWFASTLGFWQMSARQGRISASADSMSAVAKLGRRVFDELKAAQ